MTRKSLLILVLLLLPLLISGCFSVARKIQEKEQPNLKYQSYRNESLMEAAYTVKYPEDWKLTETSTNKISQIKDLDVKDLVEFKVNRNQQIGVAAVKDVKEEDVLKDYEIESQQQTEVSRHLATKVIGRFKPTGERREAILVPNGNFFYVIYTNEPGSPELTDFINNFLIENNLNKIDIPVSNDKRPIYKLFFGLNSAKGKDCQATYYREVYLSPQEEEITLIPSIIKALLSPDQLKLDELKLYTSIPAGTKLLSYGYNDNRAIVNFSKELNQAADACAMELRRSQIEKTLKSLKDVSELKIEGVDIQVENTFKDVLK